MYAEQRERYPDNWEEMSLTCKARAKWRCEQCGIAEGTWRIGHSRAYQVRLQAAHLDHDPENPNPRLMAFCQDCHLKYDGLENGRSARQTRFRKECEAQIASGQLAFLWEVH